MDLSKISVQVRPRNPYEAVDLGMVMARQWYLPLLWLWLVPALPIMVLTYLLFHHQPLWALLIVWWLKPFFESLQLRYISEKLFNDELHWRTTLQQGWKIAFHQWFSKLVWHRFAFARSFNMPVGELEQLTGRRRNQRLSTLHRGGSSAGIWLSAVGSSIESIIVIAVFSTAWMFVPVEMDIDFDLDTLLYSPLLFPTITLAGFLAMTLVAPFYVCAGFLLYINRRTWLEAWDIELTFRQLSHRHRNGAPLAVLLSAILIGGLGNTEPAQADLTRYEAQDAIFTILEGDDFHQLKEEERWRWKDTPEEPEDDEEESWLDRFGEWLSDKLKELDQEGALAGTVPTIISALEVLLWGLVIALFAYVIYRFRHVRAPHLDLGKRPSPPPPTHLFGLELNQDTLPEDVIAEAQRLWHEHAYRQAISLLYRAALTYLVHERHLPLNSSHTEEECLRLCLHQEPSERGRYFEALTQQWIRLAYAHQPLTDEQFAELCERWPRFHQEEALS